MSNDSSGSDYKTSIPPDPRMMAYLLGEFKKEQRATGESLRSISGSLSSIDTEIGHIKEANKTQDARISKLEEKHHNCTAATDIKGLNARVKNLEQHEREDLKERADQSGYINVEKQRAVVRYEAQNTPELKKPWWASWITPQMIVSAILFLLLGSAVGGFVLAKAMGYVPSAVQVDEPKEKSGRSNDRHREK